MSHFTCLVIAEDVEKALQPFHEFECTGVDDEFVKEIDITEEVLDAIRTQGSVADGLAYHGLEDRIITDLTDVDLKEKHKYGYALFQDEKLGVLGTMRLVKAVKRTNPNKRWDWWVVGGRWKGSLLLRSGRTADSARMRALTWVGLREKKTAKAREDWKAYTSGQFDNPWDRDWFAGFKTEAAFIADQGVFAPFSILKDGKWFERGRMGWWAAVSDEKDGPCWVSEVGRLLAGVQEDALLTMVDCHI